MAIVWQIFHTTLEESIQAHVKTLEKKRFLV